MGLPSSSHILFGQRSCSGCTLPDPVYTGLAQHLYGFCQASDPVGLQWQPPAGHSGKRHGCENSARGGGRAHPAPSSRQSFGRRSSTPGAGRGFLERQRRWHHQSVLLDSAHIPGEGHLPLGSPAENWRKLQNQNQPLCLSSKQFLFPVFFFFFKLNIPNLYRLS